MRIVVVSSFAFVFLFFLLSFDIVDKVTDVTLFTELAAVTENWFSEGLNNLYLRF